VNANVAGASPVFETKTGTLQPPNWRNPALASQGTIILTGESQKQYQFNIYDRSTTFKEAGALYVMSKINSNGNYELIYIGQTGDLSVRPLNHHKTACFDKHKADKLLIKAENNEKTRLAIETDLIRNYSPPCNG
jgi:hypothetical protein